MTWLPLLLGDSSVALRYLVLKELMNRSDDDPEVKELRELRLEDPLIKQLLTSQKADGSWDKSESLGLMLDNPMRNTAQALCRLGFFGFDRNHPAVKRAANYLFSFQLEDGSWPHSPDGDTIIQHRFHGPVISPMRTAFPLRGLAMGGFATDHRAEKAYEWLLEHRAEDGSWPTYLSPDGKIGYQVVGYRQMPNSRFGCRTNTSSSLTCFAYHPTRKSSLAAKRPLDMLLARETRDRQALGFEVARMVGIESAHGYLTYYARFDLALILNLCWRIGATLEDQRVAELVKYMQQTQGSYGLWEYQPKPQATRWATFDILRSLLHLDTTGDWISTEPRTRYRSYPKKPRRY